MNTGRTINAVWTEINRQETARRDFIVPSNKMALRTSLPDLFGDAKDITPVQFEIVNGRERLDLNPTQLFHRQIGTHTGIPAVYYDRMKAELPELLTRNVNEWLRKNETRQMIRSLDGKARAFLSDRYRPVDNLEVCQAILPVLAQIREGVFDSCEVTDDALYLKVVNPRLQGEVRPGDLVQAGVVVRNSEVGKGSVSVAPLLFRLVCSNGMIVNSFGSRQYHVGGRNTDNWELYTDETRAADNKAFLMKTRDTVKSAVDEAVFGKILDGLREAAGTKIEGRPTEVVEMAGRKFGLNQGEQDEVLKNLLQGGDMTLYGLSNAVTRTAAVVPDYDRATDLEGMGWDMATMSATTWKEINASIGKNSRRSK